MLSRRTHAIFYSQKQVILFSFFIYRKQKHNNVSGSSFRNPTSSPHLIDFLLFILVLIRNNTLNLYFTHTHSTQQQPSLLCSAADINRRKDRTRALLSLIRESIKFCCEKCDPDFWRWKPDWDIMCWKDVLSTAVNVAWKLWGKFIWGDWGEISYNYSKCWSRTEKPHTTQGFGMKLKKNLIILCLKLSFGVNIFSCLRFVKKRRHLTTTQQRQWRISRPT